MAVVYFDASAFVKVVGLEADGLARDLWDGCDAATASPLAHVEVRAALAAARRNRRLTTAGLALAEARWAELWALVRPVHFTSALARYAGAVAAAHALRGADAVHLASALAVGGDLVVATWDRRLGTAAKNAGLRVAPAA